MSGRGKGNATPSAWHFRIREPAPTERLPEGFLSRPADVVAPELLGCRIASSAGDRQTVGVIVETEAYPGPHDPASHAAERIGRTRRNASMFEAAGVAYVYRIYGMHWCLNVVTGGEGEGQAVLIRALDPLLGHDVMASRRGRPADLCSGPGRLCQALGVTGALDGHRLDRAPLRLLPGWELSPREIGVSPRVGIRRAADWPLRFFVRGNASVSGRRGRAAATAATRRGRARASGPAGGKRDSGGGKRDSGNGDAGPARAREGRDGR